MKLTVKELTYTYRGGHTALRNISFAARQGELLSVLGPNGAGKSTLFRCILGGLPDYGGAILLDGRDTRTLDQRALAAHIAYIPQIHRPTFGYSVLDTVLMGLTRQLSPFRSPSAQQEQQAGRRKLTDAEREATIRRLEKEMKEASKMLEFEYAALLRDQIIALRGEK